VEPQHDAVALGQRGVRANDLVYETHEISASQVEGHLTGFEAGQIEQLVDQPFHAVCAAGDAAEIHFGFGIDGAPFSCDEVLDGA
jgi:hypothetical protein